MPPGWSPMKNGFWMFFIASAHAEPCGSFAHAPKGGFTSTRFPPTPVFSFSHFAFEGHPGSPGRTRRRTALLTGAVAAHARRSTTE